MPLLFTNFLFEVLGMCGNDSPPGHLEKNTLVVGDVFCSSFNSIPTGGGTAIKIRYVSGKLSKSKERSTLSLEKRQLGEEVNSSLQTPDRILH